VYYTNGHALLRDLFATTTTDRLATAAIIHHGKLLANIGRPRCA
jgi:hypothetical protein